MPSERAKELIELLLKERGREATRESASTAEEVVEFIRSRPSPLTREEQIERLKRGQSSLQPKCTFQPGQIVRWKRGMQNKQLPRENGPAVVVEILDPAVIDSTQNAGSAYFREPLDVILGVIDSEGDFVLYHFDSRRFEPWTGGGAGGASLGTPE